MDPRAKRDYAIKNVLQWFLPPPIMRIVCVADDELGKWRGPTTGLFCLTHTADGKELTDYEQAVTLQRMQADGPRWGFEICPALNLKIQPFMSLVYSTPYETVFGLAWKDNKNITRDGDLTKADNPQGIVVHDRKAMCIWLYAFFPRCQFWAKYLQPITDQTDELETVGFVEPDQ